MDVFAALNAELDDYHQRFIDEFNLKKFYVHPFKNPWEEKDYSRLITYGDNTKFYNVCSMYFHRKKCLELIESHQLENGFLYDIIVSYRADVISEYLYPIFLDNVFYPDVVYIPAGYDYRGINDQIAHGAINAMRVYLNVYDKIPYYCLNDGCIFNPEVILAHHLAVNKINPRRFEFPYALHSKRFSKDHFLTF